MKSQAYLDGSRFDRNIYIQIFEGIVMDTDRDCFGQYI